jgi:hypothetical protein
MCSLRNLSSTYFILSLIGSHFFEYFVFKHLTFIKVTTIFDTVRNLQFSLYTIFGNEFNSTLKYKGGKVPTHLDLLENVLCSVHMLLKSDIVSGR